MDAFYSDVGVPHVRIDRRKRIVCDRDVQQSCRVEKSGFTDVGFSDNSCKHL